MNKAAVIILFFLALSTPAGADQEPAEAQTLTEAGWWVLTPEPTDLSEMFKQLGRSDSPQRSPLNLTARVWYEPECDRPEAALKLFRQAAGLDPANAEAWRGWGRAIIVLAPCFGHDPERIKQLAPPFACASPTSLAVKAHERAEPKFWKATKADPQNYRAWLDLGNSFFERAANSSQDQELAAQAAECLTRAAALAPREEEVWLAWGRGLIAVGQTKTSTQKRLTALNAAQPYLNWNQPPAQRRLFLAQLGQRFLSEAAKPLDSGLRRRLVLAAADFYAPALKTPPNDSPQLGPTWIHGLTRAATAAPGRAEAARLIRHGSSRLINNLKRPEDNPGPRPGLGDREIAALWWRAGALSLTLLSERVRLTVAPAYRDPIDLEAIWPLPPSQVERWTTIEETIAGYRRYFIGLPESLETRGRIYGQSFHRDVTQAAAFEFRRLHQTLAPDTGNRLILVRLARLYRFAAASGQLTPHYQSLYQERAEALLRRASADLRRPDPSDEDEFSASFTVNLENPQITARALALAELGLILAEKGLNADNPGGPNPTEAENLWSRAEALHSGVTRYARARWAARLGDLQVLKENLSHSPDDLSDQIFPTLAEARDDPAFRPYANEPWFRAHWYGFID